jgi:hypothetical protein
MANPTNTQGTDNPESLHLTGQNSNEIMTSPEFVNPGTPAKALTSEADRPKSEVSPQASKALSDNMIK